MAVYFAIYPILTGKLHLLDVSMSRFKEYLQTSEFARGEPDFLQYYALPYLPDPKSHPSFQVLFQEEWLSILKSRLDDFLGTLVIRKTTPKSLQAIDKKAELELNETRQSLKDSLKREQVLETKIKYLRVRKLF